MDKSISNNGYPYVDLGLPSGTLWATCNVGARKPTDFGLYFQWGDIKGWPSEQIGIEKWFNWNDYKWNKKSVEKYNEPGVILGLEDDAANINMGGDWHIPTPNQLQELRDNTISALSILDGVKGMTFTSKKDTSKSIFIPATGVAWKGLVYGSGDTGFIWSSKLNIDSNEYGEYLTFDSKGTYLLSNDYHCYGMCVRGVVG